MRFLARTHPRLSAAATLGVAAGILVPADSIISKILIGWNAGVWTYLVLMFWLATRARAPDVKRIAEVEDENAGLVLLLVCIAAIASLATIAATAECIILPRFQQNSCRTQILVTQFLEITASVLGSIRRVGGDGGSSRP